jgi:hypothetical protein
LAANAWPIMHRRIHGMARRMNKKWELFMGKGHSKTKVHALFAEVGTPPTPLDEKACGEAAAGENTAHPLVQGASHSEHFKASG